ALLPWSLKHLDERGMAVRIGPHRVRTPLLGEHNAGNLAAAMTAAMLLGQDLERVVAAVTHLPGARGRMQRVASGPVLGIVDDAMLGGVSRAQRARVRVELDRSNAIRRAARLARPGDVILLLGKGHETFQEIAGVKHSWDDAAELRRALRPAGVRRPGLALQ